MLKHCSVLPWSGEGFLVVSLHPSLSSEPDPHPTDSAHKGAWMLRPLYLYPGILEPDGTLLVALGTERGQGSVDQSRGSFQIQYLRHQILLIQQQFSRCWFQPPALPEFL